MTPCLKNAPQSSITPSELEEPNHTLKATEAGTSAPHIFALLSAIVDSPIPTLSRYIEEDLQRLTKLGRDFVVQTHIIKWYQSAIGSLMWPAVHTRPDISYSVGVLSRYCANPGPIHCNLVYQIFRYLAGTLELGINFRSDSADELVGYTDSGWAGLKDGRRSTGGYTFLLSGGPVSHQSKQQATVALSPTEAEYMAITQAGKAALWIARFLATLGYRLPGQLVSLRANKRGAILLIANPEFHRRTKHIKV